MSRRSEANLRGVPMRPYDLLREGLLVLLLVVVVIVALAAVFGSPDYPPVRGEDVATRQPIAFVKTCATILAGGSSLQQYGPPYRPDRSDAQRLLGLAPARWFGATIPINPPADLILEPLGRVAVLNADVAPALRSYQTAAPARQQAWLRAYLSGLDRATVQHGEVQLPTGSYGPVPALMDGMLDLGRAGLLEGALESGRRLPYSLDATRSLLFFQDDVGHDVARSLDMLGEQWGLSHETGPYPGAWWLWPYTFLYQIPPMSSSSNADLQVGVIAAAAFLVMLLTPVVPIINRLPRWLRVYRIIWRDWYRQHDAAASNAPAEQEGRT